MADYYDDKNNFLFVKKGQDGKLLDYIFVHFGDTDNLNFVAHYASYKDDTPLEVYRFNKVVCSNDINNSIISLMTNFTEEQTWKRVRVGAILPSKWRMFFETLEEN